MAAPANDKETLRGMINMGDGGRGEEKKESEDREKVQRNGGAAVGGRQMQGRWRRAFFLWRWKGELLHAQRFFKYVLTRT